MLESSNKGGSGQAVTNEIINFTRHISNEGIRMDIGGGGGGGQKAVDMDKELLGDQKKEKREETVDELIAKLE